jgi:hypothetical protein
LGTARVVDAGDWGGTVGLEMFEIGDAEYCRNARQRTLKVEGETGN